MDNLISIFAAFFVAVAEIIICFVALLSFDRGQSDKNTATTKDLEPCAIRYRSEGDSWIDFVVFVSKQDAAQVRKLIEGAMDSFWNDDEYSDIPYGDIVEMAIEEAGFPYAIAYNPIPEADDPEKEWEDFVQGIKNTMGLVVINGE